jgi:hypothetical protein
MLRLLKIAWKVEKEKLLGEKHGQKNKRPQNATQLVRFQASGEARFERAERRDPRVVRRKKEIKSTVAWPRKKNWKARGVLIVMPWSSEEYPTNPPVRQRGIQTGLPGAAVLQDAGYPFDFLSRLKLGVAKLFGGLESVENLPREVQGVPVQGRERMQDLIDFLHPFVSRPSFGRNPQDAQDMLDAFGQRALGFGGVEGQQASGLLKVYRNVMSRKKLFEDLGLPEEEEPAQGLAGVMQKMRREAY